MFACYSINIEIKIRKIFLFRIASYSMVEVKKMESTISIAALKKLLSTTRIHLIDIRAHYQFERGTIPTAVNIPFRMLAEMPEKYLQKDITYYVFCDSGVVSLKLATKLNQLGYHLISIEEGYDAFYRT